MIAATLYVCVTYKLRPVGTRARVRHAENTGAGVGELEVLIFELSTRFQKLKALERGKQKTQKKQKLKSQNHCTLTLRRSTFLLFRCGW